MQNRNILTTWLHQRYSNLFQWLGAMMSSQVISFLQGEVTSSISDCFCLYITSTPDDGNRDSLWHTEYELHICMDNSAQNNLSVLPLLSFIFLFERFLSLLSSTNTLVPKFNAVCWRWRFQQPSHYFACYYLMTIVVIWFSQNSPTWLQSSFSAKQSISVEWSLVQHRGEREWSWHSGQHCVAHISYGKNWGTMTADTKNLLNAQVGDAASFHTSSINCPNLCIWI